MRWPALDQLAWVVCPARRRPGAGAGRRPCRGHRRAGLVPGHRRAGGVRQRAPRPRSRQTASQELTGRPAPANRPTWAATRRRRRPAHVVIMGAGGRDFLASSTVFRNDPGTRVVAFTATQIPGIAGRILHRRWRSCYQDGIPSGPRRSWPASSATTTWTRWCWPTPDLSHEEVMHKASAVLAAGADSGCSARAPPCCRRQPVVAISAVRTWCRQEPDQPAGRPALLDAGLRVALVRHPMPYGDLERDAGAAVRDPGRHRRQQPDHRGARGVRGAGPPEAW